MKKIVWLFAITPLFATVVVQKNGDVISGKILEETPEKYIFQSPYGKLQISKNNITKLILDEKTIELKNIEVGSKTVKARLVNQENNTAVYLTEDGQTIRKKDDEVKTPAEPAAKPERRDRILLGVAGFYGLSTFQQPSTDPVTPGTPQPAFSQSFRPGTFGGRVAGHFAVFRYLGFGLSGATYSSSGSLSFSGQGAPLTYDVAISNTSVFVAPSVIFSFLGNLGATASPHDLRLQLDVGYSFNSAEMQYTFKTAPPSFPASATASGSNRSMAMQAQLVYYYSISESLRLGLGAGYYRLFHTNIYSPTLASSPPIPAADQFKRDTEGNLARAGEHPQAISFSLGLEVGF